MKFYLAGGAIRDMLLGLTPEDLDFVFSGNVEDFLQAHPNAVKLGHGPAFGFNKHEYTELGCGVKENLAARDFTINSFLLEENGALHMHPKAADDLKNSVLRPCSSQSFTADPLRIFRAARFTAMHPELTLVDECICLMQQTATLPIFRNISPDRIGQECQEALKGKRPGNFIRTLGKAKCLSPWMEELTKAAGIPAGPPAYHDSDVLEHIASTMDKSRDGVVNWLTEHGDSICPAEHDRLVQVTVWMSLCHDLGKVTTPEDILPHHYLHESRGVSAALNLGKRLRLPTKLIEAGVSASKLHMKAGIYHTLRQGTRVDLLMEAHKKEIVIPLFLLAQADSGCDFLLKLAQKELATILKTRLPAKEQNLGAKSGKRLRELRCMVLPRRPALPE